jgi:uncharacterized protein YjbI with pentapeptide repeats
MILGIKTSTLKTSDLKTGDLKPSDLETRYLKNSDLKTPNLKTPDFKTSDLQTSDLKTGYLKVVTIQTLQCSVFLKAFSCYYYAYVQHLVSKVVVFFFALMDMANIRHTYQFSLKWFMSLFTDALHTCPRSNTGKN